VFDVCKKNDEYNCSYYSFVTGKGSKSTQKIFKIEFGKTGVNIDDVLSQYITK
jgi:hypothetical protein